MPTTDTTSTGTTSTDTTSTWERYQGSPPSIYERHFVPAIARPFAEQVVAAAGLRQGERVLDVACGTGIVGRVAAERIGDPGLVAGIDGHPGMIATARSILPDADWREASADGVPFDDASFDVTLCSLGLQFIADRPRALSEMRRVVRPGGRTAVATAGPVPAPMRALHDVLAEHLGDDVAAFVDAVFSLDDPDRLRDLMESAGLEHVEATRRTIPLRLDPPADFFWQYMLATPLAEQFVDLGADRRAELERHIVEQWEPFVEDGELRFDVGMVLGTAASST
jgi:ubiquinone/menaquinone biosynthesis C-methylase UbiE